MQNKKQPGKFEYVPAGVFTPNHGGLAIYIKYKKNPNNITQVSISSRHVHFQCPDRDLYMVGSTHMSQPFPPPFDFDEIVNINPCWPVNNGDITAYMLNYTQYIGKEAYSPKTRMHGKLPGHDQMIISDSGGFQIRNERLNFINPKHLVEWYNDNVDVGIVLDIPAGDMCWEGMYEMMAKAQERSTAVMMEYKKPELDLMNVLHGNSHESYALYRSIVERPDIDRVCLGGLYHGSIMQSIDTATRIIQTGQQYKHYHFLGISNIRQLFPIIRMAAKGMAPLITSDSSTWLQEGLNKGYYVWPAVDQPPRYYKIGEKSNRPNSGKILPCSCPVCQAVKYQDVFACFQGNMLSFVMAMHNMHAFTSLTRAMYDIMCDASVKDIKDLVRSMFTTRSNGRDEVLSCFDYIEYAASEGQEAAARRLSYFLGASGSIVTAQPKTDIFGVEVEQEEPETEEEAMYHTLENDPRRKRMENILRAYGEGELTEQKDAAVKVKKKDKLRKSTGHTKHSAVSVRVPGKKVLKPKKPKVKAKA